MSRDDVVAAFEVEVFHVKMISRVLVMKGKTLVARW